MPKRNDSTGPRSPADRATEPPADPNEHAQLENWLWTHAAGLLEPDEEVRLASYLAAHPAARVRLEQIRQSFDAVAGRSGRTLAEARAQNTARASQLRQWVDLAKKSWFAYRDEATREIEAGLVAVVVATQRGLVALAEQAGVTCADGPRPVTLSTKRPSVSPPADETAIHQIITTTNGVKITISEGGKGVVTVLLELPDAGVKGVAKLCQITIQEGGLQARRLAVGPIDHGVARFSQVPAGLLEITVPGAKPLIVGITSAPEPSDHA